MSTSKYTDLFNDVLPELPGCANALAEAAIRNSVIAFCRESWCWRFSTDAQNVIAGEPEYSIDTPAGASVAEVIQVTVEGERLDPITPESAALANARGYVLNIDGNSITLYPTPDYNAPNVLLMTVALAPRPASTSYPAWMFSRYNESLAAGAKARLMRMPQKPWSNPQQADLYEKQFHTATSGARADAVRGFVRAPMRTTSHH